MKSHAGRPSRLLRIGLCVELEALALCDRRRRQALEVEITSVLDDVGEHIKAGSAQGSHEVLK